MKKISLVVAIIILASALRLFRLGAVPWGFYTDEAAYGYNAYSIAKTGKDEHGSFMPLAFNSFGDFKSPLYIYTTVPFVSAFGLNEWGVRLPSAVIGILLTVAVYLLAREIFPGRRSAYLAGFLTAVTPMGLQFSRMAQEGSLSVLLVVLGLWSFFRARKHGWLLSLSSVFFALSFYSYHDAKVIVPLLILTLIATNGKYFASRKRATAVTLLVFLLVLAPLLAASLSPALWSRPGSVIIGGDSALASQVNQQRSESLLAGFGKPALFHNKLVAYPLTFLENYATHFSAGFLFFHGDPVQIYQTVNTGIFLLAAAPFFFYGLYVLFAQKMRASWFLLGWLLIAPAAAGLTRFVPSSNRTLELLPVFSLITAAGLGNFSGFMSASWKRLSTLVLVTGFFAVNIAYYLQMYYFISPVRFLREWHWGMRQTVEKIRELAPSYDTVWVSKSIAEYIYLPFYLSYPPDVFQKIAQYGKTDQYGFKMIRSFDKYTVDYFPDGFATGGKTLFVGARGDFGKSLVNPLFVVSYPNGNPEYFFADETSLQLEEKP